MLIFRKRCATSGRCATVFFYALKVDKDRDNQATRSFEPRDIALGNRNCPTALADTLSDEISVCSDAILIDRGPNSISQLIEMRLWEVCGILINLRLSKYN
jgi:hypothetical protein